MTPSADPRIDWKPLERFCEIAATRGVTGLDADDFMWMGCRDSPAGVPEAERLDQFHGTSVGLNNEPCGGAFFTSSRVALDRIGAALMTLRLRVAG